MARKADIRMTPVSEFARDVARTDRAAALAFFLMDQDESVTGRWSGRLTAADQRALFGMVVGRGRLVVDGAREEVSMIISACYGMDFSTEFCQPWRALDDGRLSDELYLGYLAQPMRYGREIALGLVAFA